MKRILYILVMGLPMVVVAEEKVTEPAKDEKQAQKCFDIRKYNLDAAITTWVGRAEKEGDDSFGKLPKLVRKTWRQMKRNNYMVSQDDLRKLSDEVFKYSLMRPRKKSNFRPSRPGGQEQEKKGVVPKVEKPS